MYIEVGGNLQFNRKSETFMDYDPVTDDLVEDETSFTLLRLNVPVAFTWRFALGSKKAFKISPLTGINFGVNLLANRMVPQSLIMKILTIRPIVSSSV